MTDRDVAQYGITANTNTSLLLGVNSYKDVAISLDQDFSLSRVIRGITEYELGVTLTDVGGLPVYADDNDVILSIYDAYGQLMDSYAESTTGSGSYGYTYTVPSTGGIGIYKGVHSFTVSGSSAEVDEWFRVIPTFPGTYSGTIIRGIDIWNTSIKIQNTYGVITDADGDVTCTIRDSRGVVIVNNGIAERVATGEYKYAYSPTHNDPLGNYNATFSYQLGGTDLSEESFFIVSEKESELWVDAKSFLSSPEGKAVSNSVSNWETVDIEEMLADAQAELEAYIGYKVSSNIITGEKVNGSVNSHNEIFISLNSKPVYKILRTLLFYHPAVSMMTLPVSGWNIDHNYGQATYSLNVGIPYTSNINNIVNNFESQENVDLIVDYEAGYDSIPRALKKALRIMAVADIQASTRESSISEVKSGNHSVKYGDVSSGSSRAVETQRQRAFNLVDRLGMKKANIV